MQKAVLVFLAVWVLGLSALEAQAQVVGRSVQAGSYALTARDGYNNSVKSNTSALTGAAADAAIPTAYIGYTTCVAAGKGAGSLAGYAGMASAVSKLGLGGVTSAVAGAMGSSASGAAATAVVTSAVGGPLVMGGIIVGGTVLTGYGFYKGGQAIRRWVTD